MMRRISYSLAALAGGILLALLTPASVGSDLITQEEVAGRTTKSISAFCEDKQLMSANNRQASVTLSPEQNLPHDIRHYILSFLSHQKDLLRIGAVSKDWRQAAAKAWEKRWLDLPKKRLTADHYTVLAKGIFPRLRLNEVGLDEEGLNILATCSHLQALELEYNKLSATKSLVKLVSLMRLFYIDLTWNSMGAAGAAAIADALRENKSLTTVNLGWNIIGDEGTKALADAFKQNTSLTTVDLNSNTIGDEGTKALADALKQNTSLTTVNLYSNNIGNAGAAAMAEALKQNTSLATVYLNSNSIGDAGAAAMADALKQNQSLTTVYLGGNNIGGEGAKAIAGALAQNRTLTEVCLYGNCIGDEGAKAIAEALSQNTTLTTVKLGGNQIGDEGKNALEDLKRSRPSLTIIVTPQVGYTNATLGRLLPVY